jgi:hypothetical protein
MDVTLSDDDARTLRGLLQDYLPELRFEAARTDGRELLHVLIERQALCERLIDELRRPLTRR